MTNYKRGQKDSPDIKDTHFSGVGVSVYTLFLKPLSSFFSFIYEMLRLAKEGRKRGLSSNGRVVLLSSDILINEKVIPRVRV